MNKEQHELLDEAYENYQTEWLKENPPFAGPYIDKCLTQEEFIIKCKTDYEFSKQWGLTIDERELSHDERYKWYKANIHLIPSHFRNQAKEFEDKYVPTKLITISHNDKTIESYES